MSTLLQRARIAENRVKSARIARLRAVSLKLTRVGSRQNRLTPVSVLQSTIRCDWLRSADREAPIKLGGTANPFAPKDMEILPCRGERVFLCSYSYFQYLLESGRRRGK